MGQRYTPQGASVPRSGTQTCLVVFGDSRTEIVSSEPFTACGGGVIFALPMPPTASAVLPPNVGQVAASRVYVRGKMVIVSGGMMSSTNVGYSFLYVGIVGRFNDFSLTGGLSPCELSSMPLREHSSYSFPISVRYG